MNRLFILSAKAKQSVPRASGDEPYSAGEDYDGALVFPAPAGMNRGHMSRDTLPASVPRASGDEPLG